MQVDVYEIPLVCDPDTLGEIARRLLPVELERAHRLIFPEHGKRKMVSQWATREILSWHLEQPAQAVVIEADPEGKPRLTGPGPCFNLTHSGDWALLAVARHELGVDVEEIGRTIDCAGMARRFFSAPEAERVESLGGSQQVEAFFHIWTLKEAYVKATGRGLRLPLDSFRVLAPDQSWGLFTLRNQPMPGWTGLRLESALRLPENYKCALVCPRPGCELRRHRYTPFQPV